MSATPGQRAELYDDVEYFLVGAGDPSEVLAVVAEAWEEMEPTDPEDEAAVGIIRAAQAELEALDR